MIDKEGRKIEYLRLSLTDKCNLRCVYCMPENKDDFIEKENLLTDNEIVKIAELMAGCGIKKVRLTGGEPLTRKNVTDIIKRINQINGIEEVHITTNGLLLAGREKEFRDAGLKGINISLDTLREETYRNITRGGELNTVLGVIDNLLNLGVKVKVNTVIMSGVNEDEISDMIKLTIDRNIDVRFIELMPIGEARDIKPIENKLVKGVIGANYAFSKEKTENMGGPAEYIRLEGAEGKVGFISAISHNFCKKCNRIRVTSEGFLKQCLHWNYGVDLRKYIRSEMEDERLLSIIKENIYNKPERHGFEEVTEDKDKRLMNEIGG